MPSKPTRTYDQPISDARVQAAVCDEQHYVILHLPTGDMLLTPGANTQRSAEALARTIRAKLESVLYTTAQGLIETLNSVGH